MAVPGPAVPPLDRHSVWIGAGVDRSAATSGPQAPARPFAREGRMANDPVATTTSGADSPVLLR